MECVRCKENRAPAGRGYCAACLLVVRAEVEDGLERLDEYLSAWAQFEDWCATRGRAA